MIGIGIGAVLAVQAQSQPGGGGLGGGEPPQACFPTGIGSAYLLREINLAKVSGDWSLAEQLAWYGFSEATNQTAPLGEETTRLKLRYLSIVSEALSMQVFVSTRPNGVWAQPVAAFMSSADMVRLLAIDEINQLSIAREPDAEALQTAFRVLASSRAIPVYTQDNAVIAAWEESDGDLIAPLPVELQRNLPSGFKADDNYFRAARAYIANDPANTAEATRLITKIDVLKVKRKSSSFHTATLVDDIGIAGYRDTAYSFALNWFSSHATEPGSGYLLSRIAGLAALKAGTRDQESINQTRVELEYLQTRYSAVIREFDRKRAQSIRAGENTAQDSRAQITNWELNPLKSQLLLSRVYLADASDAGDARDLASLFVTTYPSHPGITSVYQILDRKNAGE